MTQGTEIPARPAAKENMIYVGKHGIDTNPATRGRSIEDPFLTISAAITQALTNTPIFTNTWAVEIIDSGSYTESFTVPSFIGVFGVDAMIDGEITLEDNSSIEISRAENTSGGVNFRKAAASSGISTISCDVVVVPSSGIQAGALAQSGSLIFKSNLVSVPAGGAAVADASTAEVQVNIEKIEISGNGVGLAQTVATGAISGRVGSISDNGSGTALLCTAGFINVTIGEINCSTAISNTGSGNVNLTCSSLSGTVVHTSTGNALVFGDCVDCLGTKTITTNDNLGVLDRQIDADATAGNIVITLPTIANNLGRHYYIVKIDASANTVTVDGNGAETINGALNQVLSAQYAKIEIVGQATEWRIIG